MATIAELTNGMAIKDAENAEMKADLDAVEKELDEATSELLEWAVFEGQAAHEVLDEMEELERKVADRDSALYDTNNKLEAALKRKPAASKANIKFAIQFSPGSTVNSPPALRVVSFMGGKLLVFKMGTIPDAQAAVIKLLGAASDGIMATVRRGDDDNNILTQLYWYLCNLIPDDAEHSAFVIDQIQLATGIANQFLVKDKKGKGEHACGNCRARPAFSNCGSHGLKCVGRDNTLGPYSLDITVPLGLSSDDRDDGGENDIALNAAANGAGKQTPFSECDSAAANNRLAAALQANEEWQKKNPDKPLFKKICDVLLVAAQRDRIEINRLRGDLHDVQIDDKRMKKKIKGLEELLVIDDGIITAATEDKKLLNAECKRWHKKDKDNKKKIEALTAVQSPGAEAFMEIHQGMNDEFDVVQKELAAKTAQVAKKDLLLNYLGNLAADQEWEHFAELLSDALEEAIYEADHLPDLQA